MKFKEWFKPGTNAADVHQVSEQAFEKNNNREYGHIAQVLDEETLEDLEARFPKTMDDELVDDYAFKLVTEGYQALEQGSHANTEIEKTIQLTYDKLLGQYYSIQEYKKAHLETCKKLADLIQERKTQLATRIMSQQYAMGGDTEFYTHESGITPMTDEQYRSAVASYKQKIDEEAELLRSIREKYARATERFYALSRQSEDHRERFEQSN